MVDTRPFRVFLFVCSCSCRVGSIGTRKGSRSIRQPRSCLKRPSGMPLYPPGGGNNSGARVCTAVQKRAGEGVGSDPPVCYSSGLDNAIPGLSNACPDHGDRYAPEPAKLPCFIVALCANGNLHHVIRLAALGRVVRWRYLHPDTRLVCIPLLQDRDKLSRRCYTFSALRTGRVL